MMKIEELKLTAPWGESIEPSDKSFGFNLSKRGIATWYEPRGCPRCGGTGVWRGGWHAGICFGCGGSGKGSPEKCKGYTDKAYENYAKAKARREAKKAEEVRKKTEEDLAYYSDTLDALEGLRDDLRATLESAHDNRFSEKAGFLSKVADTLLDENKDDAPREFLIHSWIVRSPKAIAALEKIKIKTEERAEELKDVPDLKEGRISISGEIKSIKLKDSIYGATLKMLIETEEGNRLYGTVPSAIDGSEVGDKVRFDAKINPSKDDKHFGFYSRPTKAEVLAESIPS